MSNYKINLNNFEREIKIRKLIEEQNNSEFTKEYPLNEIKALSIEALEQEIRKLKILYKDL